MPDAGEYRIGGVDSGQAADPASTLCRFLDARLPSRHLISEDWSQRAAHAPWSGIAVDVDRRKLGLAAEVRPRASCE
jgi:hypothetical protein